MLAILSRQHSLTPIAAAAAEMDSSDIQQMETSSSDKDSEQDGDVVGHGRNNGRNNDRVHDAANLWDDDGSTVSATCTIDTENKALVTSRFTSPTMDPMSTEVKDEPSGRLSMLASCTNIAPLCTNDRGRNVLA
ncbi:hypothetical protein BGZ94_002150 [Podila epigama]|nr:hypothetical protein BGZ94_002150 [Podila epigama]